MNGRDRGKGIQRLERACVFASGQEYESLIIFLGVSTMKIPRKNRWRHRRRRIRSN